MKFKRDIKQIGHIEHDAAYTLTDASRLITASVDMLRDYLRADILKRVDDKVPTKILGRELLRLVEEIQRQRKAAALESAERTRERDRQRSRAKREKKQQTQGAMFKPVPTQETSSMTMALLAEVRALRAEVAALKR